MEILEERSGKTVIWANYRHDVEKICARLAREYGEKSYVEYHGGLDVAQSEESIRRFTKDHDCQFFVATQSKGGWGITLVEASYVVYFSNNFDLEKRLQSEDRTHRSGQTKSVTYVDIVTPGTVDEKIIKALRDKKSVADLVTGDGVRDWLS
jgi:SNF2 family DNA or RNA helicase